MPTQFTQVIAGRGENGELTVVEGGNILLNIERQDVRAIIDNGPYRTIVYIYPTYTVDAPGEVAVSAGSLMSMAVLEEYSAIVSMFGFRGIIGS